jgi:hypothetical protein
MRASERDDATPKKKTGEMLGAISPVGFGVVVGGR